MCLALAFGAVIWFYGDDVNSAMPESASDSGGYTLLLYRTKMGLDDKLAYADAGAFRTNAQTASGGVRRAFGLGRETRNHPASAIELRGCS
jgi:hypothetical protein